MPSQQYFFLQVKGSLKDDVVLIKKITYNYKTSATGYCYKRNYHCISIILQVDKNRSEYLKLPAGKQHYFGKNGLYFCGYGISPAAQIGKITLGAKKLQSLLHEQLSCILFKNWDYKNL